MQWSTLDIRNKTNGELSTMSITIDISRENSIYKHTAMLALGSPQGPLTWRLCRLLPHPAGAPVYLNPAGAATGRKLDR